MLATDLDEYPEMKHIRRKTAIAPPDPNRFAIMDDDLSTDIPRPRKVIPGSFAEAAKTVTIDMQLYQRSGKKSLHFEKQRVGKY